MVASIGDLVFSVRVSSSANSRARGAQAGDTDAILRTEIRDVLTRIEDLERRLDSLERAGRLQARFTERSLVTPSTALSSAELGVPALESATLTSTAQVNAEATSYSPVGPSFGGSSTTVPTLAGVYDGAQGDDTLTFTVTFGGPIGIPTGPRFDVRDSGGNLVEAVNFGGTPPDTPFTLSNGLTLAFSSGIAIFTDSFDVDVSATTGAAVNPHAAFNGTRNDRPGFENGVAVSAGSFTVNGTAIGVDANDSIAQVAAKISASAAGVDAAFDASSETLVLTQQTGGVAPTIVLGADSSGFLAATKLAGAVVAPGSDDGSAQVLSTVAAFSGVVSGDFAVNGETITVDPTSDSLNAVLSRVEASPAGVEASYLPNVDGVSIRATGSDDLSTADGSSGFLTAALIADDTRSPRFAGTLGEQRFGDARQVFRRIAELTRDLDALLSESSDSAFGNLRDAVQLAISEVLARSSGGFDALDSGLGLRFDFDRDEPVQLDRAALRRSMTESFDEVFALIFADDPKSPGLIAALRDALAQNRDDLTVIAQNFGSGALLDTTA